MTRKVPPGRTFQPSIVGAVLAPMFVIPDAATAGVLKVSPPSVDLTNFTSSPGVQKMYKLPSGATAIPGYTESVARLLPAGSALPPETTPFHVIPWSVER